jgi:predicted alpha/beta-hydrolase family hydrolase
MMPERLNVRFNPHNTVTATVYPATAQDQAKITLILAHGAGAGQASEFMVRFAKGLSDRGIETVTFDFYYKEIGRKIPDQNSKLELCYRAVIDTVLETKKITNNRLAIGGKSMGGRIASQLAADGSTELLGLVFLGYPLHPPGKPEQLRAAHLAHIKAPMLFVQGSRDAFGTPDELRPIIDAIAGRTNLYVIDRADHSFKVPKSTRVTQNDLYTMILDHIAFWLRQTAAAI